MLQLVVALADSDCEQLHSGWLAQPANAVSALAFVVVGAWLLLDSRRVGAGRGLVIATSVGMISAGVGSVAYHGPQPGWAHVVHDLSALLLAVLVIGHTTWLLLLPGRRREVVAACGSVLPWGVVAVTAYVAGRSGSPLCHPATIWQPHALWHIFSAVTIGALGRAVRPVSGPAGRRAAASPAPHPSCSQPEPS